MTHNHFSFEGAARIWYVTDPKNISQLGNHPRVYGSKFENIKPPEDKSQQQTIDDGNEPNQQKIKETTTCAE